MVNAKPTWQMAMVLDGIIRGVYAWATVDELKARSGLNSEAFWETLADLEADGWVESWEEWPDGLAVTLTPWAAGHLGVRIVELDLDEHPAWRGVDEPDPPLPKARKILRRDTALHLVVDPAPGPVELAIAAEEPPSARRPRKVEIPGAWPDAKREAERAKAAKARRRKKLRSRV